MVRPLVLTCLSFAALAAFGAPGATGAAAGATLRVPADYPAIQTAINVAADGDTVLVAAGTYYERIDFNGKTIVVESEAGAASTVIDGSAGGLVVRMDAQPGKTPVLRGFTIRNGGGGTTTSSGAVDTSGGPALIEQNRITDNEFCDGGAVELSFSNATLRNNVISDNHQALCSGGVGGGGVSVRGAGTARVTGNSITGNAHGSGGGAISLFSAGAATISGNTITGNDGGPQGGGITIANYTDALISNNVIHGNYATKGGGIYWVVPADTATTIVNNTIALNEAATGSAIYADGFDGQWTLRNNILLGQGPAAVLYCGNLNDTNPPMQFSNDVFNADGAATYGGYCPSMTGVNGNIAGNPLVYTTGDFHLPPGSPAIDAGTSTGAPFNDVEGDTRPLDGNGDGSAAVDIGADERKPAVPTAVSVRSARAVRTRDGVLVRWRTGAEAGILGFDVYRERGDGGLVRLNRVPIRAVGAPRGRLYSYLDTRAEQGKSPRYRLRIVRLDGSASWVIVPPGRKLPG